MGSYSYVDANGLVQTVNYISDALGFQVAATNLPVHQLPAETVASASLQEVPQTEAEPAVEEPVVAAYESVMTPAVDYSYLPYATNYGYNLPVQQVQPVVSSAPVAAVQPVVSSAPAAAVQQVVAAAPVAAVQPVVSSAVPADLTNSQFHAQDDIGQYNYGYSSPTSTKQELKTADGVTRGSYSYVDANGLVQTVNYISDAMGFKVAATNLPVHNLPLAVEEEAKAVLTPSVQFAYLPYATNYGYNLPSAA